MGGPEVVLLVAAVREDDFSREPARIIRGKKYGHARDVLGSVVVFRLQRPRDPNFFPECGFRSTVAITIVKTVPIEMI
jgi:hypothetical protein